MTLKKSLGCIIQTTFHEVQFSKSAHSSCKKQLATIYKKSNIEEFLSEFVHCLKICIMHEDKSNNVEKTLDFVADFAVSFSGDYEDEETCPLLEGVFEFIFENHDCYVQLVRLRICQLMNRLLDNMGENASVLEDTYKKISDCMLVRLQDSMSSIRTQAVYALYRLQAPNDQSCKIIKAFLYHMTNDPCHEVRRAVVQKVAVTKTTLVTILTRMNDVKDTVRKEAYVVISRFLVRQFTIKQRQAILENGLGDRSDMIREYVIGVLVPNWLKFFNNNYMEFMECIHVEKIQDTTIKLLKELFMKQHDVILESRMKDMHIINQKISYKKLNIITVLYWRALAEFVKPTDDNDKYEHVFEKVLPDLTPFCRYIREYFFPKSSVVAESRSGDHSSSPGSHSNMNNSHVEGQNLQSGNVQSENVESSLNNSDPGNGDCLKNTSDGMEKSDDAPHVPDENVLVHLLEMCRVFDLSDEMGRSNLRQLCVDFLQSSSITLISAPSLARLLDHVIPEPSTKLSVMAEVITELREPLQTNDASVYVPDVLVFEAEENKTEIEEKINELESEMQLARTLGDEERIDEIRTSISDLKEELKILNKIAPQEPGRNVNNDPETLKKCLTIVVEVMKQGKIRKMNSTLLSLMQNFISPTLNLKIEGEDCGLIKNLAMQALGVFCLLDTELAKEHFLRFYINVSTGSVSATALKCVLDLMHVYGVEMFIRGDVVDQASADDSSLENDSEEGKKTKLVLPIMVLLGSEDKEMKRTAVIGLCKLLFAGRIKSHDLLSKLILLWFHPNVDADPYIRQSLGVFFRIFCSNCPNAPDLLLKAFLPTIKELFLQEVADPMAEIEVDRVINLLIECTRPHTNKFERKGFSVHNQIAIKICEEILSSKMESTNALLLMKSLSHLELNYELQTDMSILKSLVSELIKKIPKEEKMLNRLAVKFMTMLETRLENNKTMTTINNTLSETLCTPGLSVGSSDFLLQGKNSDFEVEEEEEDEEDDGAEYLNSSGENTTFSRQVDDSEDVVIFPSDESFESETDDLGPSEAKVARKSDEYEFKQPIGLPPRTPVKTPFKIPSKTPRKLSKTPIKTPLKTPGKKSSKSPAKTPAKTAKSSPYRSQSSTKKPAKRKSEQEKTPQKSPKITLAVSYRSRSSTKKPAKRKSEQEETPQKSPKITLTVPGRVTRSARKQKPQ